MIHSVQHCCKQFCEKQLDIAFTKRTLVVTAMTGTAAVNVHGETTHKACQLNCLQSNVTSDDEWENETCLVVVDETSFANIADLKKLNQNLNLLCDRPSCDLHGDLPIVFAGDFSQLKPVGGQSLLSNKNFSLWRNKINTFLELKTNHRFHDDPEWGRLLQHL